MLLHIKSFVHLFTSCRGCKVTSDTYRI